ncbi:cupin domain-containing protein [Rhodoferax sp. 4810]|nr:cupin domain-containing protein [Rhodoferax jenense]
MTLPNFFANAAPPSTGERFETLLQHKNLVIERIVSSSVMSPNHYVQPQDEWVLLVQGNAEMEVNGKSESLTAGDYLFLPANTPHAVKAVSDGALWLAVHLHPQ